MKSIFITGINGFIGRSLSTEALLRGIHVRGSSRRMCDSTIGIESVCSSEIDKNIDWLKALEGCDVVMHLAGRAHVMYEKAQDPLSAYMVANHDYALQVAKQALKAGVNRMIYVSTVKVNGEFSEQTAMTEQMQVNPQDPYSISKWRAEQSLQDFVSKSEMELVIVRPPLVYGPEVKANFLTMLKLVRSGWPLPLKSLHNIRSMIYVKNLVDALMICATHPAAAGEIFLVCDNEAVTVSELASSLYRIMGKQDRTFRFSPSLLSIASKLVGKSQAIGRLTQPLLVDSTKIRTKLGWESPYNLDQGLKSTVDWFLSVQP